MLVWQNDSGPSDGDDSVRIESDESSPESQPQRGGVHLQSGYHCPETELEGDESPRLSEIQSLYPEIDREYQDHPEGVVDLLEEQPPK